MHERSLQSAILVVVVACTVCMILPARAGAAAAAAKVDSWQVCVRKGNLDQAYNQLAEVVSGCERANQRGSLEYAEALENTGGVLELQGRFGAAEANLRRALSLKTKLLGTRDEQVARALNQVANLMLMEGDFDAARSLAREYSASKESANSSVSATCLDTLARVSLLKGEAEQAQQFSHQALALREKLDQNYRSDLLGETLNTAAMASLLRSDFATAQKEAEAAVNIALNSQNSLLRAEALNVLATVYLGQKETQKASGPALEALNIRETILPAHHPIVAESLFTMGILSLQQGNEKESENCFIRSRAIWNSTFGGSHPGVAWSSFALALVNVISGKVQDANAYCREAVSIQEKIFGKSTAIVDTYEELYKRFLWEKQQWIASLQYGLAHTIAHNQVALCFLDYFGVTLTQSVTGTEILETKGARAQISVLFTSPIFIVAMAALILLSVVACALNLSLLNEFIKERRSKLMRARRKFEHEPSGGQTYKTVYGDDGKLDLKAQRSGAKAYWQWKGDEDKEVEELPE